MLAIETVLIDYIVVMAVSPVSSATRHSSVSGTGRLGQAVGGHRARSARKLEALYAEIVFHRWLLNLSASSVGNLIMVDFQIS